MPDNVTLYLLLVVALGIGYLIGRLERRRPKTRDIGMVAEDYLQGLNYLLNERHDEAIDTFVEIMAVDNDTVDTHLALGSLVRRRGEVAKAIRIHQNLLARPALSAGHRRQTELELARDYLAAGLLGRAENLLKEIAERKGGDRQVARQLLLEVYQREKEWESAVTVGLELARSDRRYRTQLAHFECELAVKALAAGDLRGARAAVGKATGYDAGCARSWLVAAEVAFAEKRYREVRRLLGRARDLDPDLAQETLKLYQLASDELNDPAGFVSYLRDCLKHAPLLDAVWCLAGDLEQRSGPEAANDFVVEQLLRDPSLGGFVMLLKRLDRSGGSLSPEQLALVRRLSESLLSNQASYRCRNCGFSGRTLIWQCPSCRTWGSIKPIVRSRHENV